jgi:hypothetical protein
MNFNMRHSARRAKLGQLAFKTGVARVAFFSLQRFDQPDKSHTRSAPGMPPSLYFSDGLTPLVA